MLNTRSKPLPNHWMGSSLSVGLMAALAGTAIGLLTLLLPQAHLHQIAIALTIGAGLVVMIGIRQARYPLLIAVCLSIPLNAFSISPFSEVFPYNPSGAPPGILLRLYDFPLMGLLAYTFIKSATQKMTLRFTPVDFAALALMGWGLLTIFNAAYPAFTFFEFLRMLKLYVLARLIALNIQNERDLRVVIGAILAGALLQTAISVAQYITNNDFGLGLFTVGELRRVTGTLGWPNTLGAYGASVLLLSLALWVSSQGGKWMWLMNLASFALVILSYSRGAWIATLLGALVVIWLCLQLLIPDANKILNRVFTIILIAAVIVALFADSIFARVENISPEMDVLVTRARLNQIAYNMINTHPVMGVGQNNFMEVIRSYDTTGITVFNMEPVHNVFLLIAAETGLMGLTLFILLLGAALLACWRVIKGHNRLLSATAIGLIGALLAIIITNTADVHLRSDGFFAFFWCLLGLLMALENLAHKDRNLVEVT